MQRYCELVAALKLRTTNKQGHHLSTRRAIELLEEFGVETPQGFVRAPQGLLHETTVDVYLRRFHLDQGRLQRQPPAVRFQAEHSNDCWQFDMSPSALKHIDRPEWVDPAKGEPTLMLFSIVDDRSGVNYQEYRCVYGEDAESALRFLFNAMATKADSGLPLRGRPKLIYLDNEWLMRYLLRYNDQPHRSQACSRVEDWLAALPSQGVREMCTWDQFCRLAREPERRRVGADARIHVEGTLYEVDPDLAGETVTLLWGLFDDELHVEFEGERTGPYHPVSGPIPLHRYRRFKPGKGAEAAERIRALANQIGLPIQALSGDELRMTVPALPAEVPSQPFEAAKFEDRYPSVIAAKLAIAAEIARPLVKLTPEERTFIDALLAETLVRSTVLARVRAYFFHQRPGAHHAS